VNLYYSLPFSSNIQHLEKEMADLDKIKEEKNRFGDEERRLMR